MTGIEELKRRAELVRQRLVAGDYVDHGHAAEVLQAYDAVSAMAKRMERVVHAAERWADYDRDPSQCGYSELEATERDFALIAALVELKGNATNQGTARE